MTTESTNVKSTVIALVSAFLILGSSAATATLAVGHDRRAERSASDPASCPPEACSVVVKTDAGGAPSRILAPTGTRTVLEPVMIAEATN